MRRKELSESLSLQSQLRLWTQAFPLLHRAFSYSPEPYLLWLIIFSLWSLVQGLSWRLMSPFLYSLSDESVVYTVFFLLWWIWLFWTKKHSPVITALRPNLYEEPLLPKKFIWASISLNEIITTKGRVKERRAYQLHRISPSWLRLKWEGL